MKHLLAQGLGDAVGFVVGALLGFFAGQLLGCDVFDEGYSTRSMVGIALVGLGGGMGLQAARRWLNGKAPDEDGP
ncbi:MAG: hypothetical protein RL763_853 [Pseudomonadota bacterium]|jgi:hypothetical protein